ncbi:cytochrome c3 family protein [Desulfitobacterium sp.]|uniref:cytochrome c3 family protein n=1 Tax=Desulfitobacterium sp. TaxID=49981 RepID=UPI002BA910D9|nr:NapC/NirT family cytochrome c [Desulfitobacterium sp.]HVJ50425.1 NapC/NirT family cytochrome c [Desulfitobacterium sp.]
MASDSKDEREQEKLSVKKNTKKLVFLSLAGLVVLFLIAGVGMHYTSQPNFCTSCHEISPHVATWQVSPHNNVPCLECHANPGTVGYVSRKLKSVSELYYHFTNQIPANIVAKLNIETCILCHTGKNNSFPEAKNITLTSGSQAPSSSHAFVLENKVSCLNCHRYTAHPPSQQTAGVK